MSKKTSQPALYEKMRMRNAPVVAPQVESPPVVDGPSVREQLSNLLGPGRTFRFPAGYVLLAAGVVILLVWFAYMVGHSRGVHVTQREIGEKLSEGAGAAINDPTIEPASASGKGLLNSSSPPLIQNPDHPPVVQTTPKSSWGPIAPDKDPRKKGMCYYILAETNKDGSLRIANFCRENGLETYVISVNNGKSWRVVAFPGFEESAGNSPMVNALEKQIQAIGDKWQKKERGARNFAGAYQKRYDG